VACTANQISTTSDGSAACRSVRTTPGGSAAWISARVSATACALTGSLPF
jgi:hypothetical protein